MSCMFRASGKEFDVDGFLKDSPWCPESIHHRGESKYPHRTDKLHEDAGFSLVASEAEFEFFDEQVADALVFLQNNREEIMRLASFIGLEFKGLDFGVKFTTDIAARFFRFSPELSSAAGSLGLTLELSVYGVSQKDDS